MNARSFACALSALLFSSACASQPSLPIIDKPMNPLLWPDEPAGQMPPLVKQSEPIGGDERIRHVVYDGSVAVRLMVGPFPTLIEFAAGEHIQDIASDGNLSTPKTWDIVWRQGQNYLFIKPNMGAKAADMTVKTGGHSYVFDLLPVPDAGIFDIARTAKLVVELPKPVEIDDRAALAKLRAEGTPQPPIRRNDRYTLEVVKEVEDVRPREVFDDGRFTYMKFPNNLTIPAVYKSTPQSTEERLINSHMEGDYLVLQGVAPLWNLRLGGTVLGVFNERYDAEGIATPDGTTVDGLVRRIK